MMGGHQVLITSEIDNNYFIINGNKDNLVYLDSILSAVDKDFKNLFNNDYLIDKKIFINKNSDIGIVLNKLIFDKIIFDESQMMRRIYIDNALFFYALNDIGREYVKVAFEINSNKEFDSIDVLKNKYDESILKYINELGRKFQSFKKTELTGYEMEGLTIKDNTWCYFNLENEDRKLMVRK